MCVHQQFDFQGKKVPSNLVLRGESIDKYFALGKVGSDIRFEFTPFYRDMVHQYCRKIAAHRRSYETGAGTPAVFRE